MLYSFLDKYIPSALSYVEDAIERNVFITSDTRFGANWDIVEEENYPIIRGAAGRDDLILSRWNKVVKPEDVVIHLGNFFDNKITKIKDHINKLNGRIVLFQSIQNTDDIGIFLSNGINKKIEIEYSNPRFSKGYQIGSKIISSNVLISEFPSILPREDFVCLFGRSTVYGRPIDETFRIPERNCCVAASFQKYTPILLTEAIEKAEQNKLKIEKTEKKEIKKKRYWFFRLF